MKKFKNSGLFIVLTLFLSKITFAASDSLMGNPFAMVEKIMLPMFKFMSLTWIPKAYWPYAVKAIIFITAIILIDFAIQKVWASSDNKIRKTIAFAISAIGTIFMPNSVVMGAGNQYGGLLGAALFLSLPGLAIWAVWKGITKWQNSSPGSKIASIGNITKGFLCIIIVAIITAALGMLGAYG